MKSKWVLLVPMISFGLLSFSFPLRAEERLSIIENEKIRVGVNLDLGGSITFLESKSKPGNLINSHDWGRQVQMSFYSGPVPFAPEGSNPSPTWMGLGWNPIQSGDYAGNRSKILDHKNDDSSLYVKCIPMQWPLDNVPGECTFESWIRLEENRVHVKARLNNARSDTTQYPARGQELPAVYVNGPYHKVMSYTGDQPFTGGELERFTKIWRNEKLEDGFNPWSHWVATEGWSALVNDEDWGVGVWTPETQKFVGGFYQEPGIGGPKDPNTGYLAPVENDILDHDIVYDYGYVLIVDSLEGIRGWVQANHGKSRFPDFVFDQDRQHCVFHNAEDPGWPIQGAMRLKVTQPDSLIEGPTEFWKAEEVPNLFIRMAYLGESKKGRVAWKTFENRSFSADRSLDFEIVPDGELHTYKVDLSSQPTYTGPLLGLGVYPVLDASAGETIQVQFISHQDRTGS